MSISIAPATALKNEMQALSLRASSTESFVKDETNIGRLSIVMDRIGDATSTALKDFREGMSLAFTGNSSTLQKVKANDYLNVANLYIQVPYGLKVPFVTLVGILDSNLPFVTTIEDQLFQVERYLLRLLGSKSSTEGTVRDKLHGTAIAREKEMLAIKEEIKGCFDQNSDKGTGIYGHFFARNAEWEIVCERTEQLTKNLRKVDIKKILKRKDEIESYSKDLRAALASHRDGRQLSSFMADEISQILYSTASELEFLSSYIYFCNTLSEVMKKNNEDLGNKLRT